MFAVGVYPSAVVQQEESRPFQDGLWVLTRAFHPLNPRVLQEGARGEALRAPWVWGLQLPLSNGTSEGLRALPAMGASGHHLFLDLPSRLLTRTFDLQYDPLTLLLVGVLSCMASFPHGWALTWSWGLQHVWYHTRN